MQGATGNLTFPFFWGEAGSRNGLSRSYTPVVENGMQCIDFRLFGTPPVASEFGVYVESSMGAQANPNTDYTFTSFMKLVGVDTPLRVEVKGIAYDSSGSLLQYLGIPSAQTQPTREMQRYGGILRSTHANTAFIRPYIVIDCDPEVPIDITLRIGLPQLELGASASSPIPTFGAAATRAADNLSMTDMSWYQQSGGVLYCDFQSSTPPAGSIRSAATLGVAGLAANRIITGLNPGNNVRHVVIASGSFVANFSTEVAAGEPIKSALRFAQNNFRAAANGALTAPDTSGDMPAVSELFIGKGTGSVSAEYLNGIIREIAFIPNANINDRALQALTK
jgi:hypothetical protein